MSTEKDQTSRVWKIIRQIAEISDQDDYIYRGEPKCYDKVSSSLYRKYKKRIETSDTFDIIEVIQEEILVEARKGTPQSDDFEILSEFQHYGGETNLIDFTTGYPIALFYACNSIPTPMFLYIHAN